MTTQRKLVLVIAAILALAVIAGAVIYSLPKKTSGVYRESIERAELYYDGGEYRLAALEYRKAIESDNTSVEAYEGLAYAYLKLEDTNSAWQVADEGYKRTHSDGLLTLITNIEDGKYGEFVRKDSVTTITGIGTPVLDDRLLRRIGGSSYGSYVRKANPLSSNVLSDGSVEVVFAEVPGTLIFRNTASQPNAVSGHTVSDNAIPEEIRLDDIAVNLFGKAPLTREELESLGAVNITSGRENSIGDLLSFTLGGCSFAVACDENDTILSGAYNSIIPTNALANVGIERVEGIPALGNIIDAQTGEPVSEVTLRFYEDGDYLTGEPVLECQTDVDGNYTTDVPAGVYTVEVSGDGYITQTQEVEVGEADVEVQKDFVITKELADGEARIVLEWGATPTDLDSHLIGNTDSGTSCQVFFGDKSCSDSNGAVADLDLDDTSSYGPETTTIYNLNGTYEFWVNNFTPSTGTIEGSGATVTVYLPGQSAQTFNLSDGSIDGEWWYVCTIDHGSLTSDSSSAPDVSGSTDVETEETASGGGLTMEDCDIPYGYYSGYLSKGDGAIDTNLQLNEDMTYELHCIMSIFEKGEAYDSDGHYTYAGSYRISGRDDEGNPVLAFENDVENFTMTATQRTGGVSLGCNEYPFYVNNYSE